MKEQTFSNGTCRHFPFSLVRVSADHKCCRHPCAARDIAKVAAKSAEWSGILLSLNKGAFLWGNLDQDQWSKITRIMVHQRNRWIPSGHGFIGSFDEPWSEWSWITDPDPDHPKGTRPKIHRITIKGAAAKRDQYSNHSLKATKLLGQFALFFVFWKVWSACRSQNAVLPVRI